MDKTIYFADLFAGIGGFHTALSNIATHNEFKTECVYVSEIDKNAINVYCKNYNFPNDQILDIKKLSEKSNVQKDLDIVFCGFPCQPFSNAGKRMGFEDKNRGDLIFDVIKFTENAKPKFILLENVKHLINHNNSHTYEVILKKFEDAGYKFIPKDVDKLILSPNDFGIQQKRERVFIPLVREDLYQENDDFSFAKISIKEFKTKYVKKVRIQSKNVADKYYLKKETQLVLKAWTEFVENLKPKNGKIPVFYIDETVNGLIDKQKYKKVDWYKKYVDAMVKFYNENKLFIDKWVKKYNVHSWENKKYKKLEWQAGTSRFNDAFLQMRQSGLRFRKNDVYPTLVASVQTPIIYCPKKKSWRYLTPHEVSKLQSFPKEFKLDSNDHQAYKQFGNSVNVKVVEYVINAYLLDKLLK